jgi:heme-degrading monooxygenase HmoA
VSIWAIWPETGREVDGGGIEMIARTWRGAVRAGDGAAYAEYIRDTGLAGYASTPGNRGAWLLYRIDGDRAEVLTVSLWDSLDDIHGFAGDDIERAVFYPEDDRYLVERDLTASHWEVVEPPDVRGEVST